MIALLIIGVWIAFTLLIVVMVERARRRPIRPVDLECASIDRDLDERRARVREWHPGGGWRV